VQAVEQLGQALTVAALDALVQGHSGSAAHWLGRARQVHATPASRVLEQLVAAASRQADAHPVPTGLSEQSSGSNGSDAA
jgi:hypothetical protein